MKCLSKFFGLSTIFLLRSSLASAHHNAANTYMNGQRVTWQGVVTFVSGDGAHVMYQIDVKDANGAIDSWQVLGGSPRRLAQRGIFKKTINAGDSITVEGFLQAGTHIVTPISVSERDGRKLYVGYVDSDAAFSSR